MNAVSGDTWTVYYELINRKKIFRALVDAPYEDEVPEEWVEEPLASRPNRSWVWNEDTGVFNPRRKPPLNDAIDNIMENPLVEALPPITRDALRELLEGEFPEGARRPKSQEDYSER